MPDAINNQKGVIEIQEAGSAHAWAILDLIDPGRGISGSAGMDAVTGGGAPRESVRSRDYSRAAGQSRVIGSRITGNQPDFTGTLRLRSQVGSTIRALAADGSLTGIRVRYTDSDFRDRTVYNAMRVYPSSVFTAIGQDAPALQPGSTQEESDSFDTYGFIAGDEHEVVPMTLTDKSGSLTIKHANKVIAYKVPQAATQLLERETSGDNFMAVTDFVTGTEAGELLFTDDAFSTVTATDINGTEDENALDLVINGSYVFVVTKGVTTENVAYALVSDIEAGVATPFSLAGGISGTNPPNAIAVSPDGIVWLACDNGFIFRSVDGGFNYTAFESGSLTTDDLTEVAFNSSARGWFAGANGKALKFDAGVLSLLTVTGLSTTEVGSIGAPEGRDNQVFLGAADGEIYRSLDAGLTWSTLTFDGSGAGSVDDIQFTEDNNIMYILHTDASADTIILRDHSGGNAGADVETIGSRTSPVNDTINSIAPVPGNQNRFVAVGEIETTNSYIALGNG